MTAAGSVAPNHGLLAEIPNNSNHNYSINDASDLQR